MSVTQEQAEIVRAGFVRLHDRIKPASVDFYKALFRRDPGARALFRDDIEGQGMKFMSVLKAAVDHIKAPGHTDRRLDDLGHMHHSLRISPENFAAMEEALIETLKAELGDEIDPTAEAAWRAAYNDIAATMRAAV